MSQFRFDETEEPEEFDEIGEYYFQISEEPGNDKRFILIIYDIVDNRRRVKIAKLLSGDGFRVQKSAFEAMRSRQKYEKLIAEIPGLIKKEDSVRVYRITGKGQVSSWGEGTEWEEEEVILI